MSFLDLVSKRGAGSSSHGGLPHTRVVCVRTVMRTMTNSFVDWKGPRTHQIHFIIHASAMGLSRFGMLTRSVISSMITCSVISRCPCSLYNSAVGPKTSVPVFLILKQFFFVSSSRSNEIDTTPHEIDPFLLLVLVKQPATRCTEICRGLPMCVWCDF